MLYLRPLVPVSVPLLSVNVGSDVRLRPVLNQPSHCRPVLRDFIAFTLEQSQYLHRCGLEGQPLFWEHTCGRISRPMSFLVCVTTASLLSIFSGSLIALAGNDMVKRIELNTHNLDMSTILHYTTSRLLAKCTRFVTIQCTPMSRRGDTLDLKLTPW